MELRDLDVAPLVGAWIEIPISASVLPVVIVAPLVGAWIEIISHAYAFGNVLSLLL